MEMLLRTRKNLNCSVYISVVFFVILCGNYPVCPSQHTNELINSEDFVQHFTSTQSPLINTSYPKNCTPPSINEFPKDGLNRAQRQKGWIILHVLISCYLLIFLGLVCDHYFVPAIRRLCDTFHLKEDITGATFMAVASSSPELFINCIGTFVTEGDIGVGAIVGSAVFNVLAVPACCGIFTISPVDLDWWPLTRDSFIYAISIIMLIVFLQDGKIFMYEALILVLMYIVYILIMYYNSTLQSLANRILRKFSRKSHYNEILSETSPLLNDPFKFNGVNQILETIEVITLKDCEESDKKTKIWVYPSELDIKNKLWWMLTWPLAFLLHFTTPNCRKHPKLYLITFLMCVFWIGITTYVISWFITAIGDTLGIPDSVMGLTILAAGMSVPEAVSSVIVTKRGFGSMGLSSAIGSNTFDILLCLGIPWLIKTIFYRDPSGRDWIKINSGGINYSATSLLSTLFLLYLSVACNKFRLNRKVGIICLIVYLVFLIFASLMEMNIFFYVNPPTCDR